MSALSRGLAAVVTAGTVPYGVLKVAWLTGGDLGLRDPGADENRHLHERQRRDAGAGRPRRGRGLAARGVHIEVAGAGSGSVGVGATGLMITPVVTAAITALAGGLDEGRLAADALHPWVYGVVYSAFAVQGAGIATLFGLRVVRSPAWSRRQVAARLTLSLALGVAAAAFAGVANLGVTAGLGLWPWDPGTASGLVRTTSFVTGCLCLAAGVGSLGLRRGRTVMAPVGVWIGTGAMVCWSAYTLLVRMVGDQVVTAPAGLLLLTATAGALLTVVWTRQLVVVARSTRTHVTQPEV